MLKYCMRSITVWFTVFLFTVFVVLWFYVCNCYSVLYYHEQIQLFQFDGLYFRSHLGLSGGLVVYLGSFLTQFYFYPLVGSMIIAIVLVTFFLLFYNVCRVCGNIEQLFFIYFIPAVLLMMSFADGSFDMSAALGILFSLAGFSWYVAMSQSVRYGAGTLLITATYFIAGGNALLLLIMILIFELLYAKSLKGKNQRQKKWGKFWYLLLLFTWSALLPWLSWYVVYSETHFAMTPVNFSSSTIAYKALWLSLPVLYISCRLIATKTNQWNYSLWKTMVLNSLLVAIMTVCGAYSVYDRKTEIFNRMTYNLENGNFESLIALSKNYLVHNTLHCYLTNIALAETGQMPYSMFQYSQMGTNGLFLDWHISYSMLWHLGEVYYRLGMIQEAEHCAFEALVSCPKEPNVQTLRRLVITNIIRRDSATAEKYLRYFDHSLAYRKWAKQQREYLLSAMKDSTFLIPNTPIPCHYSDFFIDYKKPDYSLLVLLKSSPQHRMAFEYLMSYWMLQKNIEQVKRCMDQYYGNFDYQGIPIHYEEALVLYKNLIQAGDDFYAQYPVSEDTRNRFDQYIQILKTNQGTKREFEQFEKQFANTYWYYVTFIDISTP